MPIEKTRWLTPRVHLLNCELGRGRESQCNGKDPEFAFCVEDESHYEECAKDDVPSIQLSGVAVAAAVPSLPENENDLSSTMTSAADQGAAIAAAVLGQLAHRLDLVENRVRKRVPPAWRNRRR